MTTNQDPSSNKKSDFNNLLFNAKDIEIYASLLKEYSDKLLKLCDNRDRYRNTIKIYLLGLILTYVSLMIISPRFWPDFSFSHGDKTNFIVILFLILIGYGLIQAANQRLRLLERDMKIYAIKLEKLIRITSQANEHILHNIAIKLKVDFRLTDAESALAHYNNTRKNLF